jgi:hypothetical protein
MEGNDGKRTSNVSMPRYELDSRVHKWLFDTDGLLTTIDSTLRGVVYDPKNKTFNRIYEPLLSDSGINFFLAFLRPYTSRIFSLSNFDEKRIERIMMEFEMDLIVLLGTDTEWFGVDENQLSVIIRIVSDTIYSNIRRALGGKGLDLIQNTQQTTEVVNTKSKNPFNLMGLFNRRD